MTGSRLLTLLSAVALSTHALAFTLSDLTQADANTALKDALAQGAQVAVQQLGKPGGFNNNEEVRIELPGALGKAAGMMKMMGYGKKIEALENTMNAAAETAVPQAQGILVDAVKNMSVQDAKGILEGSDNAATQYLNKSSREQIRAKFLPIVKQATSQVGLVQQYNAFASQVSSLGVTTSKKNLNIEDYVTEKALDGLFTMIGQQEASIRENPAAAATSLAKKVFGVLQ
ncbi:DUF4197 domain-containing protein [Azomonas macrocytogenes]|uniref:DUF4197 domain-containing protein n=1 Tax=Azomonas macrocytogenes TaxID=69962 RepID=A0A839T5T6_AZOMA|nr:DUF4197 domain-containing protein [Azomonas macrocytogenes]MBB3103043.1 hypothetical protein [Azomonas macrocytogenes]